MSLEERISHIETRNQRVSLDKAWERSFTRRLAIAVITYLAASLTFLILLPNEKWFLAAIIPTGGYLLSTLGLPQLRLFWKKFLRK